MLIVPFFFSFLGGSWEDIEKWKEKGDDIERRIIFVHQKTIKWIVPQKGIKSRETSDQSRYSKNSCSWWILFNFSSISIHSSIKPIQKGFLSSIQLGFKRVAIESIDLFNNEYFQTNSKQFHHYKSNNLLLGHILFVLQYSVLKLSIHSVSFFPWLYYYESMESFSLILQYLRFIENTDSNSEEIQSTSLSSSIYLDSLIYLLHK